MEMPADSKEFMAVEKALLQEEGYADDDWDLSDGTQKAYKAAKLKRWNLDKIRALSPQTRSGRSRLRPASSPARAQSTSCPLSWTPLVAGIQNPALVLRRNPARRTWPFRSSRTSWRLSQGRRVSGQACHVYNFVFNYFFCILVSLGSVEKDMSKITGVAARLQTRQDPALKQKAKELSAFLKDQAQYMEQATQYLGAGEEARKGEINEAYLQVLQNHSDKMGELHAAVKDKLRRATALL